MATEGSKQPQIDISSLPDISKPEMDFLDTSFFQSDASSHSSPPQLPTPAALIEKYGDQGACVIIIEELNLAVKVGGSDYLRLEEVQTMRAVKQAFPDDEIPVPEVFGWRKVDDENFIYMSLVDGQRLQQAWPSFTEADKESITGELRVICEALRGITQGSSSGSDRFIGSINGGPVTDRFFKLDYEEGPFHTIKSYNDWLLAAATRQRPGLDGQGLRTLPQRDEFPDTGNIYFTHGDLTLNNIMISGTPGSYKIAGIIDWEQAGWYPEYWEYCKMLYAIDYEHEWRVDGWAEKVLKPWEEAWEAYAEFTSWRCP